MSIQSEIDRIGSNVRDAISAIRETGVTVPEGANSDALPSLVAALTNEKQDKLTGQQGQVVGFNSNGDAVAQDAPQSGITQGQADKRYLQLTGGTVNGYTILNDIMIPGANPELSAVVAPNSKPFAVGVVDESSLNLGTAVGFLFTSDEISATKMITLNGNKLKGIPETPTDSDEAASKAYVDKASGMNEEQADERYLRLTGGTITGSLHVPDPQEKTEAANRGYVDSKSPKKDLITLPIASWSGNTQTVSVSGVLADESKQLIQIVPAIASQAAYIAAGVLCTGQAENSLTFTYQTIPTEDLSVYVVIQEVSDTVRITFGDIPLKGLAVVLPKLGAVIAKSFDTFEIPKNSLILVYHISGSDNSLIVSDNAKDITKQLYPEETNTSILVGTDQFEKNAQVFLVDTDANFFPEF